MTFDDMLTVPGEETKSGRAAKAAKRPSSRKDSVVGGLPKVSLLPPEIRDAARTRVVHRILAGSVGITLVVTGGMIALASTAATSAAEALTSENAQTASLSLQVLKFKDIQALQASIAAGEAGVKVGTSTQIDWKQQIADVEADMPSNYTVTTVTADSASVITDYPQGTSPLELPRAATVTISVKAPDVIQLPIWLRKLRSIPAYADATASYSTDDDGYSVVVTVHLSKQAIVGSKERSR